MEPSSSPELPGLGPTQQEILLDVARSSIAHGLVYHEPLRIESMSYPQPYRDPWATFVTLHLQVALRGCIGTLDPVYPLVESVARNAYAAAMQDPRFSPVTSDEQAILAIHISILSTPQQIRFCDEADLLCQLRVGTDGLILNDGASRSTLLPSVWKTTPRPSQFLAQLKCKAGLAPDYWSTNITVLRYEVESVE